MSTFRFESGNLRALRNLPVYALARVLTALVLRTDRIWVFGSGIGLGEGALAVYELARERLGTEVRTVWLTTTPAELAQAKARGFDAVPKSGLSGLWLTLRASVCVVTHGMGDVNRFGIRGSFVVQLWHGIPLKKLHIDSPAALRVPMLPPTIGRRLMRIAYRSVGRQISMFPVASDRIVSRISSAFGISPDRVVVTGDPRDDVLLQGDPDDRRERARAQLDAVVGPIAPDSTLVLYAPTWRDGEADPSLPDDTTWDEIISWLDHHEATLIVRAHPLSRGDYSAGLRSSRVRMLGVDKLADVTPVLPAVDALVTDYSSIAFDYALVGGPIVFLAPDATSYARSHGLYEPYRSFSGGRDVVTWRHALLQLDAALAGDTEASAHTQWLRTEYFDTTDGSAAVRVLDEILRRTGRGEAARRHAAAERVQVTQVRIDGDTLHVRLGEPVSSARLVGPRASVEGEPDGANVRFPLLMTRWGRPGLALPSGEYRLTIDATTRVAVVGAHLDERHRLFRVRAGARDGGLSVRIGPPLRDGESARHPNLAQRLEYLRPHRLENAVYFESFYGHTVADNPLGIDRVLAAEHPKLRRYWSTVDGSVAVPEGATRIIEGSAEWWRVRATARVYVVNDWLRWAYRPRRGQHVLQTWHGTMLKRLARDRPDASARRRLAVRRQSWRWDALLVQNYYSARIFRTAYAFDGPIWETGYPRNDAFADTARAEAVRATLGISGDIRVVLYAPTWRDDHDEMVDYLDLVNFADDLPGDHLLLVRGHSRTLRFGQDLHADRLLDVTSYPDIADLMSIADVLVTDYSSVMFDFAATSRPIVLYTPDLSHYEDVLRGFYFDLVAEAPGPVVATRADLLEAIRDADASVEKYAARRALWREKFAPHEDGRAAERVVQRMFDAGWLG